MILQRSSFYIAGDLAPKVIAFFTIPILTRILKSDEYGIIVYVNALLSIISPIFSFGSATYMFKAINLNVGSYYRTIKIIHTLFWSLIAGTLSLSLLLYLAFKFIPFTTHFQLGDYALYIVSIAFFSSISNIPLNCLRVYGKAKNYFSFNLFSTILENILIIILITQMRQGMQGWFIGKLITSLLYAGVICITFRKILFKKYFNKTYAYEGFLFGIPFTMGSLLFVLNNISDRFILERYITLKELGLYGLAYSIAFVIQAINSGIAKAVQPNIIHHAKNHTGKELQLIFTDYQQLINTITFTSVICFLIANKYIFDFIISPTYRESFNYVIFLSIAPIFLSIFNIYSSFLVARGKKMYYVYSAAFGLLANLVINILLIPEIKVFGAIIATIISYFIILIVGYYKCKQIAKFVLFDKSFYILSSLLLVTMILLFFNFFDSIMLEILSIITIISTITTYIFKTKTYERLGILLQKI